MDFLKRNKAIIGVTIGLLDILVGLTCCGDDTVKSLLFVSLGAMFIIDALE